MYVYTDGSCTNNGKENAMAGIGIYFGKDDTRNVSKRVLGKQTNNTAELGAFLEVYEILKEYINSGRKLTVFSDSTYAIRCVGEYGKKCENKNWGVDIPNKELVKKTYDIFKDKSNVKFEYIKAHTGKSDEHSMGNDNADRLANEAIGLVSCPYTKIYLNVPYKYKEDAKKYGCKWDPKKKKWYTFKIVPELELYM